MIKLILLRPSRTPCRVEIEPIRQDWTSQRKSGLYFLKCILAVLIGADRAIVVRIQNQPGRWGSVQGIGRIVEPCAPMKLISAGTSHGGNNSTECAAVAGFDSRRLHLNLLHILKNRILPRRSNNCTLRGNAVDKVCILRATGPVDLNAAFDFSGVDAGREIRELLIRSRLGQAIKFILCNVQDC
jgi:hypothetical protein